MADAEQKAFDNAAKKIWPETVKPCERIEECGKAMWKAGREHERGLWQRRGGPDGT